MSKIWTVIFYEYRRHVLRRRFLIALLSVPLWLVVIIGVTFLAIFMGSNNTPLGYVDHSGLLANPLPPEPSEGDPFSDIQMLPFSDEDSARIALAQGKIQAFYILPGDYPQNRSVRLVYKEEPSNQVQGEFRSFLRRNLLAGQPELVAKRVSDGPQLIIRANQENREVRNNEWFKIITPVAAGILLIIVIFTTGGYLMQSVVEEKENRTMEILATSISPMQIMGGKTLALMAVGLTQVLVWGLIPIIGVLVAAIYIPAFRTAVDWWLIGLVFLLIMPTFIMISALMAAIGATVTEAREGQQITGLISLPVMIPYMLMGVLITNPGSPVAVFLSLFPLTSALTILIRMGFSTVPAWQIASGAGILLVSALGSLWLAGRIFRLGMLRYGQRMRWKELFAGLRNAA
jgi:ABC-2 type transport system permease protein